MLISLLTTFLMYFSLTQVAESTSGCIIYDSTKKIITITCEHANFTEIYNAVNDSTVLHREAAPDDSNVWVLNANIEVANHAILYVNSTDTSWLKILADGKKAYLMHIMGSLKIDSVKITSWNQDTNDYATTEDSDRSGRDTKVGTPRPYIVVEKEATGTTDITNSEIAYLGYEAGYGAGRTGLRYLGGDGSIIKGNNIHHLWFALYTRDVGGMVIENNHIHHNGHYGLDPHTATHDMIIRNNTVHDNGSIGIICSLDCHNITIDNNKVYNNTKMGIMFSRNMYDSVARNNIVSNEERGIVVSESHNNKIHNNTVLDSGSGIDIDRQSSKNTIRDNIIVNIPSLSAVKGQEQALKQNSLFSNTVITSDEYRIDLNQEKSISNATSNITSAEPLRQVSVDDQEKSISNATSNITSAEPLRQVSVDRTINVTKPYNPVMDAFYYLFGWK